MLYEELIHFYKEYIGLLTWAEGEIAPVAYSHGFRFDPDMIAQGERLRAKIKESENKIAITVANHPMELGRADKILLDRLEVLYGKLDSDGLYVSAYTVALAIDRITSLYRGESETDGDRVAPRADDFFGITGARHRG